ncbi:MAG: serine protease [Solirubrobacteraceae bacterium]|jgi:subtilisin family serine protease|nr:serine protease [Solirubrobacteraceae bacterium]
MHVMPTRPQPPIARPRVLALAAATVVVALGGGAAAASPALAAAQTTGRLLVTLAPRAAAGTHAGAMRAAAASLLAAGDMRRSGAQVPQIGLVSVRPQAGTTLHALASALRRRAGVRSVEVEHRHQLRVVPNDPALSAPEAAPGTPAGTVVEWWAARLGLPAAWDITRGTGATVAVIDTGIDAGHPELGPKIDQSVDNDATPNHGPATVDENGHGTHVASLACAAGDNGVGIVGVGLDCHLLVFKSDLGDGSVARSIVQATDLKADAINMSFGTDGTQPASQVIVDAVNYAVAHDVVLVAAAADSPVEEQGDPANLLQPSGTGADIAAGRGLSVTAATASDARASFAGRGSQISLAGYGTFAETTGPNGLLGAFPGNATELESGSPGLPPLFPAEPPCGCRSPFGGDARYAELQGTSMAAPMVSASAALVKHFNPDLHAPDVIRLLKQTATRPAGATWTPELGWGIVNPAAALTAARLIDRRAPASKLTGRKTVRGARSITLRVSGTDTAPAGVLASGIAHFDIYRGTNGGAYRRLRTTSAPTLKVKVKRGSRYRFYSIAVDRAGNREPVPARSDLSTRVAR